jgi:uncharacterized membrane protein
MGKLEVDMWVPGTVEEVAPRWVDTDHWPDWMDEVEEVLAVSADWPAVGASVHWRSPPAGRGEVTETIVEYADNDLIATELVDSSVTARQTVTFTAADDGVAIGLTLDYRISKRGPLTPLLDRFFVRPAMRSSLTSTIERFGGELTAHREP